MRLSGRVALVTRGPTGTGRATVLALAREGAVVAINYSEPEAEAGETARLAEHAGPRALPVQADVTREPEVRTMVGRVAREPGGLDGLVNNAGWTQRVPHRQLDVVPHTEPRPEGAIVNITSVAHAASKAGLDTLTKPLARALAPSRIRVNAVAPGPADPRSR